MRFPEQTEGSRTFQTLPFSLYSPRFKNPFDITLYRYSNQVDWFDLDSQVQVPRAGKKQSWNLILVRSTSLQVAYRIKHFIDFLLNIRELYYGLVYILPHFTLITSFPTEIIIPIFWMWNLKPCTSCMVTKLIYCRPGFHTTCHALSTVSIVLYKRNILGDT